MFVYDPEDETTQRDPYPLYRVLRDEHPVYRQPRLGFYALSRFADVMGALRAHDDYCSRQGLTWDTTAAEQAGVLPMLVTTDPPDHTKLRKLINRGFTPSRVAALEADVRALVEEHVAVLRARGAGDLVTDLAVPVPTAVVGRFLGVPPADRPRFHEWASAVVAGTSGAAYHADHHRAIGELYAYFGDHVERARRAPADDLVATLVHAEIDGKGLDTAQVLGFCFNIIVGGIETTTNLITGGMALLEGRPDVRARLAVEPARIPSAVEEFLRLETPVQGLCRTATRPLALHGATIPAGAKVLLLFGAANRDEREFVEPDRLDVERPIDRHLAFGYGAHFCIGAALARVMGRVAFETILSTLGPHRVRVERGVRARSAVNRGWASLRVELAR